MSELRVATAGDDGTVGAAVEAVGGAVVPASEADALVTFGEDALVDTALADPEVPLLPVDAGPGNHSVPKQRVDEALDALASGEGWLEPHAIFSVAVGDERAARALLDVSLMTREPARISEYSVRAGAEEVDRFRADGVVVATPAGSAGYARAAGGSVVVPGGGLSVVPVAPFETMPDTWVLDADLTLVVKRDDSDVDLVADGRVVGSAPAGTPIEVARDGRVEFLRVPGVAATR
ncbi:NAD(+)/NADH kinase [Halorarum halophilum]|uniref:NAD(+)/NADH kinase n=1 Tax=Halorarum halophilum TaxID=2743090 RepID=A0A7D5KNG1_9EURY|nr:NAD(+)/NADH kinase [Halobaculum halophilum]QLG29275.1 NAD(+)/NADH kinase [Halobaculum halophilum]